MFTGPGRTIGSPTKSIYVRKEGNFEETELFYCFSVEVFPNRIKQVEEPLIIFESEK